MIVIPNANNPDINPSGSASPSINTTDNVFKIVVDIKYIKTNVASKILILYYLLKNIYKHIYSMLVRVLKL